MTNPIEQAPVLVPGSYAQHRRERTFDTLAEYLDDGTPGMFAFVADLEAGIKEMRDYHQGQVEALDLLADILRDGCQVL